MCAYNTVWCKNVDGVKLEQNHFTHVFGRKNFDKLSALVHFNALTIFRWENFGEYNGQLTNSLISPHQCFALYGKSLKYVCISYAYVCAVCMQCAMCDGY